MPVKLLLVSESIALGVELINRFLSLAARLASGMILLAVLIAVVDGVVLRLRGAKKPLP